MKWNRLVATCSGAIVFAACSDASTTRPLDPSQVGVSATGEMGFDWANTSTLRFLPTVQMAAVARSAARTAAGPPILYHAGGRVIPLPKAAAIYWSNGVIYSGGPTPGTAGVGTADGSVIGAFLRSLGNSSYWSINNEYTDNVGGAHQVSVNVKYSRFYANNVGAPGPGANVSDANIRAMLTSTVGTANMPFDQQTIYAVFSGPGVNLGGGFGTQYCAYHGFFARPGHPGQWILYTVLPRAADFVGACTAINTPGTGSPNEFSADAMINILAAQLDAAVTDPGLNAWFDANGFENSAKCAWLFTPTFSAPNGSMANVTLGGANYLIQQNWRIGPNAVNQIGCTLAGNLPLIALSPPTLTFNAVQNGPNPASQLSTITNGGGGTLSGLSLGTTTYGPGATGWLQVPVLSSPTANPSATVTVQPTTGTLAPGTYTATIPVLSTVASNSPQNLSVSFTVDPAVASVTVTPSPVTVPVGGTQQMTATLRDQNGNVLTGRPVSWSSSNPATASVSVTGLVTGVAAGGPVTITATSEGVPGTASVTVGSGVVTSVTVTPTSESLRGSTPGFGWTRQLVVVVNGSPGVSQAVTYASGNSAIASVTTGGLVTAGAAGQTQVTVTSVADPTKFGTYDVTVIDGCTNIMPVALGYTMAFTFMCFSTDVYSYTAPTDTWVQLEANVSAFNGCGAALGPFIYVVGISSFTRAYVRSCSVLAGAWAYVRAGPNRFSIGRAGGPFATSYSYTGAKMSTLSALPQCTTFSSDFGVTFSVDLTVSCTSHLALLAGRIGTLAITASSAAMAVTVELINNSTGAVVATATSAGPGFSASIPSRPTIVADVFNVRILPAIVGGTGTVAVTISP